MAGSDPAHRGQQVRVVRGAEIMTENLAAALAAFQAELPTIGKGNTASVKSDKGSYSYKYADLADVSGKVLPLLAKHGLSFSTKPTLDESGRFVLEYTLRHSSGESDRGSYPLSTGTPQQVGSAITYARRYVLCAITGVAPDQDDDGAAGIEMRTDPLPREKTWDPTEQEMLLTAWTSEIGKAKTADEITSIGKQLLTGKRNGEISPNTYAKLAAAGGRRKAEIEQQEQA